MNILPYSSKKVTLEWQWRQSDERSSALGACYHSENNLFPKMRQSGWTEEMQNQGVSWNGPESVTPSFLRKYSERPEHQTGKP